jgi:hypothetical protein
MVPKLDFSRQLYRLLPDSAVNGPSGAQARPKQEKSRLLHARRLHAFGYLVKRILCTTTTFLIRPQRQFTVAVYCA